MAAPAYAGSGTHRSGVTATPSFDVPDNVAAGDIIVLCVFIDGNATITGLDGFAEAPGSPVSGVTGVGGAHSLHVLWRRATGTEDTGGTYDLTLSASVYSAGAAHRYTGVVTSGDPWEATDSAVDDDTLESGITPPVSVVTTGTDRRIVWAGSCWAGGSWTPPAGYAERMDANDGVHSLADIEQAAAGSTGPVSGTCTSQDRRRAWLGALLPNQLAPGVRAGPGLVGFLGDPGDLIVLNANDPLTGTVFDGVATWDTGNLIINATDLVVDGYQINAPIVHSGGTNLTIRNCVINAPAGVGFWGIGSNGEARQLLTVEDTTVVCAPGPGTTVYSAGIQTDSRAIVRRCDVSGSGDGIHVNGAVGSDYTDGSIVSQCYVHGLSYLDVEQHVDAIQVFNATLSNTTTDTWVLIEHNYVAADTFGPTGEAINSAVTLGKPPGDDTGPLISAKVDNNALLAGAFHLRHSLRTQNGVITNNNFGTVNVVAGEFGFADVALPNSVIEWNNNRDGAGAAGTGNLIDNPNPPAVVAPAIETSTAVGVTAVKRLALGIAAETSAAVTIALPGGNVTVWNGAAEVSATVTVWDGAAEVPATVTVALD